MAGANPRLMVYGDIQLRSPWFSSEWTVAQDFQPLASIHRFGRIYVSSVRLPSGEEWLVEPHGPGVVRAVNDSGGEIARVIRRSWLGRRWDLVSQQFAYELISNPRPRRWSIAVGGAPAAIIEGSLFSYNQVDVQALIGVPLVGVILAWHVIARPWEAASEPRGLVPSSLPRPQTI